MNITIFLTYLAWALIAFSSFFTGLNLLMLILGIFTRTKMTIKLAFFVWPFILILSVGLLKSL